MTSRRKHNKQAKNLGLSDRELLLAELVEEMVEQMRWLWVLGYSNQYLVQQTLKVDKAERDKILEAATRSVEKDQKLHEWQERLARIKDEALRSKRGINRAKKEMARERRRPGKATEAQAGDDAD